MSTILKCGALFDGITEDLHSKIDILIEKNRIAKVGKDLRCAGADVIDLSDCTVTPGMIDAHVHTDILDWKTWVPNLLHYSENMRTLAALHSVQRSLRRGFTAIRSMGSVSFDNYGILDVKRAINQGLFEGARLVVAPNCISSTGGHGDITQHFRTNPTLVDFVASKSPFLGDGADAMTQIVRKQIMMGADFIKIMATGGFFSPTDGPEDQHLSDFELQAIIETSIQMNKTVTAHAYSPSLMQKLIGYGIHGIEHGALMDEQTARLMEKNGTYLVPTFCPYEDVVHYNEAELSLKPIEFQSKLKKYAPRIIESRKIILDSTIKLGYGTDFVAVHQCYENGYEYSAMLKSGMKPFRALKAATSVNAEILGLPEVGTIAEGKLADIAAWKRDLLTDHTALLDCSFVMKDGKTYTTESVL